jgi:hypothetical protein
MRLSSNPCNTGSPPIGGPPGLQEGPKTNIGREKHAEKGRKEEPALVLEGRNGYSYEYKVTEVSWETLRNSSVGELSGLGSTGLRFTLRRYKKPWRR